MRQTNPVESLLNIQFLALSQRLSIGDSLSERLTTHCLRNPNTAVAEFFEFAGCFLGFAHWLQVKSECPDANSTQAMVVG